jgi:hypothetical protein
MSAESHLDWIGIMLICLDNLPQRHRSVTLHAAAPDVDFRIPVRCEKNSRLLRSVLAQFSVLRLPLQATGHWHIACGNCGNSHGESHWGLASLSEVEGSVGVAETAETPSNADTDDVSATPSPARAG